MVNPNPYRGPFVAFVLIALMLVASLGLVLMLPSESSGQANPTPTDTRRSPPGPTFTPTATPTPQYIFMPGVFRSHDLNGTPNPTMRPTPGSMGLLNPGFEGGMHKDTSWYLEGDPTPRHTQFTEVNPGDNWVATWIEGETSGQPGITTGRPEVIVIDTNAGFPDPLRIAEGTKAQKWFTFWRPHLGGLAQQFYEDGSYYTVYVNSFASHGLKHADLYVDGASFEIGPNGELTFVVSVHVWFSDCDTSPHEVYPLESNCALRIDWAEQLLWIGIDPTGGEVDMLSPNIVWSPPFTHYGVYGSPVTLILLPSGDSELIGVDPHVFPIPGLDPRNIRDNVNNIDLFKTREDSD